MTDERRPGTGDERAPDPDLDPDLDPVAEAEVRRLLGEARETGPPPSHVVARLDETLAALRAEPREAGGPAPVVVLRRRRVRQVLLGAAAAVVVVGVAIPVGLSVTGPDGGGDGEATVSAEAGDAGKADRDDLSGSDVAEPPAGLAASPDAGAEQQGEDAAPEGAELLLSQADFETQVAAFVERGGIGPVPAASCGAPPDGRRVAARYEGDLATLLLTPVEEGIRARLYVCGDQGVVRRVDVRVE